MAQTINVNTPEYLTRTFNAADYGVAGLGSFTAASGETYYKVIGDYLFLHLRVVGTIGASTQFIALDFPNSYTPKHTNIVLSPCSFIDPSGNYTFKNIIIS